MIHVNKDISIDEREIKLDFIRASGPGGQNVNKVASAVQLRFDVHNTRALPESVRRRLSRLAKNSINEDGILIIEAKRFRTQHRNREDALERLVALIQKAAVRPKKRIKTKPSAASRQRMHERKRRRSLRKRLRAPIRNTEKE